jgi:hypothetical protein
MNLDRETVERVVAEATRIRLVHFATSHLLQYSPDHLVSSMNVIWADRLMDAADP